MKSSILKLWAENKGWRQKDIADRSGISSKTISEWFTGKRKSINTKNTQRLANAFDVFPDQFLSGPPNQSYSNATYLGKIDMSQTIPLLGSIPAGDWKIWFDSYPVGFGEEIIPRYDVKGNHIFALKVDGDSMEPELHSGDILIIDPERAFQPAHSGRIGVVKFDGAYKIRKVFLTESGDNYQLVPLNQNYAPEVIPVTGTTIFKIVELRPKREELF